MEFITQALQNGNTKIRMLHAIPNAPNVDIYANGIIIASNLSFGAYSDYFELAADTYEVQLFKAGFYDNPLITQSLQLAPGSSYTASVVTLADTLFLLKLRDAAIPASIKSSYLRFINLSQNSPLLSLTLQNDVQLFDTVEYLETTGYSTLSPGIYNFRVVFSSAEAVAKNIRNITLGNGKFYTIYIIGLFNGKPPLGYLFVEDIR